VKWVILLALAVIVATSIIGISNASKTQVTCTTDPTTYESTCTTSTP
jgi:hypothetical protein